MPKELTGNSSNSELVMQLIGVLNKEASLFETFLELLEKQQKALVKNDMDALNEITMIQRERVMEAGILARKRKSLASRLTPGEEGEMSLTISRLIKMVSDGQAGILESLRSTILELNEKISKVRLQNEMLINRSRENIMKTMELFSRIKAPDKNYHGEGKRNSSQTNLALDRRA